MGGPRTDFTFPRVVEAQLAAEGRPSQVTTMTMTSEQTRTILSTWQREVLGFSPDVIVLVYGHFETVHLFLPRWLERHANSLKAKPRRLSTYYRTHVLRPVWMTLAKLQAKLDTILDPTIRRGRPRRVAADLERYITHVQGVGSPLVLLLELLPPADRYQTWFPGMAARIAVMNEAISDMVRRIDLPNVRYVPIAELVDKYAEGNQDIATPDGFHFSPVMHREIGIALAQQIEEWADTQPHLALESSRHRR
ncbi:MAG: SGNH/GDSL hydrolase family protein [Actinomycetota bacterium]|nr:SGNH/GDSL hydrolase family protein [Actinomycetota bacterium]